MIVVTTPTGTIGRQVLENLLDSGEPIRVIARDPSRVPSHTRKRVEVVQLHSWLQSLRFQLRETSVAVLELAPPYVQTELGGPSQATDANAMPLADYIGEVMQVLSDADPSHGELLVKRVKALRWAEQNGDYEQMFTALNEQ